MNICRVAILAIAFSCVVPRSVYSVESSVAQSMSTIAIDTVLPIGAGAAVALGVIGAMTFIARGTYAYFYPVGKIYKGGSITEKFDSIAGQESIKEEIQDVVDCLRNPEKYDAIGFKVPKGILMHGPPGTGKTSLVRAMAGEVSCSFIVLTGSELGRNGLSGADSIKALFRRARFYAPCIIFIDEIDSLSGDAQQQLLTEMDGFERRKELVIVVGATNFPERLHAGLLRPGRFDRVVKVDLPSLTDRKKILAVYAAKIKTAEIDLDTVAELTGGFSCADLANLINEASILALHAQKAVVDQIDLENALDKLSMGKPIKDKLLTREERRIIAYHEAGHALVNILLGQLCNPLYKVTIVAHDHSEGFTATVPKSNIGNTKEQIIATITTACAGRAAEMLVFNRMSTGAVNDLVKATRLAREIVCEYGMSGKIGPIILSELNVTSKTSLIKEEEIHTIVTNAYNTAYTLLQENRDKLDLLTHELLEKETLSGKQVHELLFS